MPKKTNYFLAHFLGRVRHLDGGKYDAVLYHVHCFDAFNHVLQSEAMVGTCLGACVHC